MEQLDRFRDVEGTYEAKIKEYKDKGIVKKKKVLTSVFICMVRAAILLAIPQDARLQRRRIALGALSPGSQPELGVTQHVARN